MDYGSYLLKCVFPVLQGLLILVWYRTRSTRRMVSVAIKFGMEYTWQCLLQTVKHGRYDRYAGCVKMQTTHRVRCV